MRAPFDFLGKRVTGGMTGDDVLQAAIALERDGDAASAARLLEGALLEDEDPRLLNRLAVLRAREGDFKRATQLLKSAALIEPENPVYRSNLRKVWHLALRDRRTRSALSSAGSELSLASTARGSHR